MDQIPTGFFWGALAGLLLLSGFFSASETGLLSINPYRLRHWERSGRAGARRVAGLLLDKGRLLSLILVCNNLVNISASVIATLLGLRLHGDVGVAVATGLLTLVIVVFAEIAPKTLAALHPERIAFPVSWLLRPMLAAIGPLLWLVNRFVACLLRPFGVDPARVAESRPDVEELRSIVHQTGHHLSDSQRDMLLNVLALETARVESIMTPRADIVGVDLDASPQEIGRVLGEFTGACAPVYRGDPDHIIGALPMRRTHRFFRDGGIDKRELSDCVQRDVSYIPASVSLYRQLLRFQQGGQELAVVVDEYGATEGVVSREGLLEDIVGAFQRPLLQPQPYAAPGLEPGQMIVDGAVSLRELNKVAGWDLPIAGGATTLNGLLLDRLGVFPDGPACVRVGDYVISASKLDQHRVARAEVWRRPVATDGELP